MSISVIIPAYNRETLLPLTLNSVLSQTLQPDEVIVVDDGSTDGTADVVQQYAPLARCLKISNSGDHAARNVGVRAARGTLVAFCDSDDLWQPDFLASMQVLWQVEPRLRAACSDFVIVRNGVWEDVTKFATAPSGYWDALCPVGPRMGVFGAPFIDRLLRFQPFFPSCLVVDRQAFLAMGGWDEAVGRVVGKDFATLLRLAEHPPFGVLRRPLVGIRKHAGNYSADVQAMNLGNAYVLEHALATRPSLQMLAGPIRASIQLRRLAALDAAFARRNFEAVQDISNLMGALPLRAAMKSHVAALREPWRRLMAEALLASGSLRQLG